MQTERFSGLQPYQPFINVMLRRLAETQVVERLWAGDASLWHPSAETQARIRQRLGWLALPSTADDLLEAWIGNVRKARYTSVLIVASGAAAAIIRLWRDTSNGVPNMPRPILLDTIEPVAASAILDSLEVERTAVVVLGIEKSVELAALCTLVFARLGCQAWRQDRLLLVTTPESSLGQWVKQQVSAQSMILPPTVSERFGALSHLGWVGACLYGHSVVDAVNSAQAMRRVCRQTTNPAANPGLLLGVTLGVLAQQNRDILTFVAPPALAPLVEWITQFVAGSLSKHRRGFVPVVGESLVSNNLYRNNRIFVRLSLVNKVEPEVDNRLAALEAAGHPVLTFMIDTSSDMSAEIARWEVAVSVAATIIGLNPFDEPDTDAMQGFIEQRLSDNTVQGVIPRISYNDVVLSLHAMLDGRPNDSYAALVCYFEPSAEMMAQLDIFRTRLQARYQLATLLVYPLRDPSASAQIIHAGRDNGMFIALTTEREPDIAVSPDDAMLDRLCSTRLAADVVGWQRLGRAFVVINLGMDGERRLHDLHTVITKIV